MRLLFIIFLTLFYIKAFNQTPIYYLDSVRVKTIGTFDPNKIDNINVVHDKDPSAPYGKVFIKSKNPKDFNFLSAKDIARLNNISIKTISFFMLDNQIIMDTVSFKIDSSYIKKIEIIKASEIEYLPQNIPDLAILKILTDTIDNNDKYNILKIQSINQKSN